MRQKTDNDHIMTEYITAIFKYWQRSFSNCELCGKALNGKHELHHTKYEGATIHDIQIVCHKCNTQQANRYLT